MENFEIFYDSRILPDVKKRNEKCRHCNRIVTAVMKKGYGCNQVMAFFDCSCGESWFYDVNRKARREKIKYGLKR